jgi:ABC-type glycerol-3-phosphate transport system permease component
MVCRSRGEAATKLRRRAKSSAMRTGDAATVDGANHLDIFWRIYLPLSTPALTAHGVITALIAWNLYLWPLIVLQSDELKPVTLIIARFASSMNLS